MDYKHLFTIDEILRAGAKNTREARRILIAARQTAEEYSPQAAKELYDKVLKGNSPLMAFVRSRLPEGISNAELCRTLSLTDSTRRRLDLCETYPSDETLALLREKLNLNEKEAQEMQRIVLDMHTRFGTLVLCCLAFQMYDPVYVNDMLARWLTEAEALYSGEDILSYDAFEGDWEDWRVMQKRSISELTEKELKIKESMDKCSKEFASPDSPIICFILKRLKEPMRPGHFYRHCTLKKSTWEDLNNPECTPSEKTLWKVAVGLKLSRKGGKKLFQVARTHTNEEVLDK